MALTPASDDRSYNVIYDHTNLRVRPDGARIRQTDNNYALRRGMRQAPVKDTHGNWVARDAGGAAVLRKKRLPQPKQEDNIVLGEDGEFIWLDPEEASVYKTPRAENRRKLETNLDFIGPSPVEAVNRKLEEKGKMPVPSSELLKAVHYFAAQFYDDRGELLNYYKTHVARREARKAGRFPPDQQPKTGEASSDFGPELSVSPPPPNKATKIGRNRRPTTRQPPPERTQPDVLSDSDSDTDFNPDSDTDSSVSPAPRNRSRRRPAVGLTFADLVPLLPSLDHEPEPAAKKLTWVEIGALLPLPKFRDRTSRGPRSDTLYVRDMYRRFEGSALMALGMLIQEYVAKLVKKGELPVGWEEELACWQKDKRVNKNKDKGEWVDDYDLDDDYDENGNGNGKDDNKNDNGNGNNSDNDMTGVDDMEDGKPQAARIKRPSRPSAKTAKPSRPSTKTKMPSRRSTRIKKLARPST